MMRIDIPAFRIRFFLKCIIALNIFFLAGTWLYHDAVIFPNNKTAQLILLQLNLALENVAAATYSSMLLLIAGILGWFCFIKDRQNIIKVENNFFDFGWLLVAAAFVTLSFDEMGSFHESIGETKLFKQTGGSSRAGWYLFYAAGLSVAVFMAVFFLKKIKVNRKAMLLSVLGMLLLLSNPLQEKFEWYSWAKVNYDHNWHRPVFFLLLEEGSELFAAFCFIFSLLLYAAGTYSFIKNPKPLHITVVLDKKFIRFALSILALIAIGMFIIYFNPWNITQDDAGKAQNWPPSTFNFIAFLLAAGLYNYFKTKNGSIAIAYLFLAFTSLYACFYFGADIYSYTATFLIRLPYILLILVLASAIFALIKINGLWCRIFTILWLGGMVLSVFIKDYFYKPFAGLVAAAFLIAVMASHFYQSKKRVA